MIRHPLAPLGVVLAAGILAGRWVEVPPLGLLAATGAVAALGALSHHRGQGGLLWLVVFLLGWCNYSLRTAILNPHDLRVLMGEAADDVWLQGVLRDTPAVMVYGDAQEPYTNSTCTLRVEQIRWGRQPWQPAAGEALASTRGAMPASFVAGSRVVVNGVLQPPPGPAAPGLFDYRQHLRNRGIYYQLRVADCADWQAIESARAAPLSRRFLRWAQATLAQGLPVQDEALRLTWAMLLGWKPGLTDEVSTPFMRTGTMHIFAISGLHIAMMAGILLALLRLLSVRRGVCGLIVLPAIWFYTGATGWQASAVRAAIMATVMIAGWSLRRPANLLNSLFAAGVMILLWDPRQLFQASFQLSFFVVLALALLCPIFETLSQPWFAPDPLLPAELVPVHRVWALKGMRWLAKSAGVSAAAWFGSFPLIAQYFSLVTPVSLAANLVIVPLSGFALASGLGSLLTGWWFPGLGELFNHSGWFFMRCMMEASDWLAALPGAYTQVAPPAPWFFVVYYGVLVAVSAGWIAGRWRGLLLAVLALSSLGWIIGASVLAPARLTILPLDDGHAILWREKGDVVLVDCGRGRAAERTVAPFLRAQGINRLPTLALTHGDLGQIGGAEFIRTNCHVERVFTGPLPFRSPTYRALMRQYEPVPGLLTNVAAGARIGRWKVLHPAPEDVVSQADDGALVLRGDFPAGRCLLLSDLGRKGQSLLLQRWPAEELRADVLVTGLPSQDEPLADHLLLAVQPRLVIVADALYPASARASRWLQARLEHYRIPVLYTRLTGAVTIEFGQPEWRITSLNGPTLHGLPQPRFIQLPVSEVMEER